MLQVVRMLKTHVTQAERHERGALLNMPLSVAREWASAGLCEPVDGPAEANAGHAAVPQAAPAAASAADAAKRSRARNARGAA